MGRRRAADALRVRTVADRHRDPARAVRHLRLGHTPRALVGIRFGAVRRPGRCRVHGHRQRRRLRHGQRVGEGQRGHASARRLRHGARVRLGVWAAVARRPARSPHPVGPAAGGVARRGGAGAGADRARHARCGRPLARGGDRAGRRGQVRGRGEARTRDRGARHHRPDGAWRLERRADAAHTAAAPAGRRPAAHARRPRSAVLAGAAGRNRTAGHRRPDAAGEPPAAIQLAVYRILQEALTNAIRHGDGAVDVHLAWLADRVDVDVRNTVTGEATVSPGGHGVIGMRERAQLVGGSLQAERRGAQFVVHATLPIGVSE